jgi:hypothetical protein
MSDFQTIVDRVEIEALRGEFTDAAMMRRQRPGTRSITDTLNQFARSLGHLRVAR